jgi:hypothetical protein
MKAKAAYRCMGNQQWTARAKADNRCMDTSNSGQPLNGMVSNHDQKRPTAA